MDTARPRETLRDLFNEAQPYLARYLAAWAPMVAAYLAVFLFTTGTPFGWALFTAFANIAVPVLLGIPVFAVLARFVFRASPLVQLAAHMALSLAFTLTWYAILMLELGWIGWLRYGEYQPVAFTGPALTWQLFQGLTVYFLIAAGAYVIVLMVRGSYLIAGLVNAPRDAEPVVEPDREAGAGRLFVKGEDGYYPLDFDDIVSISGADDYCEVRTSVATHLIRMTLAAFEQRLDPDRFVRVHRSHIVALARIQRVEPRSGGGLTLHMAGGGTVLASRAGAAALQGFLVT